jgi:hypothetical protein
MVSSTTPEPGAEMAAGLPDAVKHVGAQLVSKFKELVFAECVEPATCIYLIKDRRGRAFSGQFAKHAKSVA